MVPMVLYIIPSAFSPRKTKFTAYAVSLPVRSVWRDLRTNAGLFIPS
jgi:hypothetical protein